MKRNIYMATNGQQVSTSFQQNDAFVLNFLVMLLNVVYAKQTLT